MLQIRIAPAPRFASWVVLLVAWHAIPLRAAPPTIERLSLHGLQSGGTTSLAIVGNGLSSDARVLIHGVPVASQGLTSDARPDRIEIEVAIDSAAAPGIYHLRVTTPDGISNPLPVAIDAMPQQRWGTDISTLPVALSGTLNGNATLQTKFLAKKGQPVVLEIEARRIGSQLRPVIHIYDQRHVQVAWAQGATALGGDARLTWDPPADGQYFVELHDSRYNGGKPGHFRLKIGAFEYANVAIPAAVQRGARQIVRYAVTNLPPDTAAEFVAPQVPFAAPAPWPVRGLLSGPRPRILVSDEPQTLEQPQPNDKPQTVPFPGGMTGRLSQPGEEDRYELSVEPGRKLRFNMLAERLGSPMDGILTVLNRKGETLATADDGNKTTDPSLGFTAPKDTDSVTLAVKDALGRGGRDYVYHLSAMPADLVDFSLKVDQDRVHVPAHGSALMRVVANRSGYDGPIRLRVTGLPPGVQASDGEIPSGSDVGFCTLAGTTAGPAYGIATIVGEADGPTGALQRLAVGPINGASTSNPWLRSDIGVALTEGLAPLSIAFADADEELSKRLPLGGRVELPIAITRADNVDGDVVLSLVSTQRVKPQRGQRQNKNAKEKEDEDESLLRLQKRGAVPARQARATATLHVPADLPSGDFGVVVRGEALAADGKTVLSTAYTPVRWMQAVIPFSVKLEQSRIEARAGEGATGELAGTVTRTDGFTAPVVLSLEGLPKGLVTPRFEVPAGESDFRFPVSLSFGVKPGELKVRLISLGKLDPARSQYGVRGEPLQLTLNVTPGERPKTEKPLTVFEDEQDFVDELTEGEGVATLSDQDKYSGSASLLVKQKPRFRTALPGLGVKIRENPGPGEYRFIRFAWKSVGGQRICLQLIDDEQGEPAGGTPAKLSYHAGRGPECEGRSVIVDHEPPKQWTVVTRDLFADFGEFTLSGMGLVYLDGKSAFFDHIYLGRTVADLDTVAPGER